jgi:hypothetical protein
MATPEQPGYDAFSALITEQLEEERARKQSLEQRGLAVVTSSGTLVALLFALAALVTKPETFRLTTESKTHLGWAVVAFAVAGVLGIFTNKPLKYEEPSTAWLRSLTSVTIWNQADAVTATRRAAQSRVNAIASFRRKNVQKVRLLTTAITFEVVGVGLVAIGVVNIFG